MIKNKYPNSGFRDVKKVPSGIIYSIILVFFIITLLPSRLISCTTFFLKNGDHFVCGRNFDFPYTRYLIMTNQRNVTKTALQYPNELVDIPAIWTSRYGSITFNIFGQDTPTDGMNEAGLVVSALILVESEYPNTSGIPSISIDQWVQYLLDNFATVNEVIEDCSNIKIRYNPGDYWRLHLFVTDETGQNAVIEFINSQLVATTGNNLEKNVISNSSYENSIQYFHNGRDPNLPMTASLNRYYTAVEMIDAYNGEDIIEYSYSIMDAVAQSSTKRQQVFDITNKRIYLISDDNEHLRYFDLNTFDFDCQQQSLYYEETNNDEDNIRNFFTTLSSEVNLNSVELGWQYLGVSYTQDELNEFAGYQETFLCNLVDAGNNQDICQDFCQLSANSIPNYSGNWSVVSGNAVFDDYTQPNTYARNLATGPNILRWSLTGNLGTFSDEVLIKNNHIEAYAGEDLIIGENSLYLSANEPINGSGKWSVLNGNSIVNNENNYNSLVTNLSAGLNSFVWQVNRQNCTDSDTVNITYDIYEGVRELSKGKNKCVIYPNPARQYLTINFFKPVESNTKFVIYNISGQVVFEKIIEFETTNTYSISLTTLPKGTYTLCIFNDKERKSFKFTKL